MYATNLFSSLRRYAHHGMRAAVVALTLGLGAGVAHAAQPEPAPIEEAVPPSPGAGYAWVPGHWEHHLFGWSWQPGYWIAPATTPTAVTVVRTPVVRHWHPWHPYRPHRVVIVHRR